MTILLVEGFDNVGTTGNYLLKRSCANSANLSLVSGRFGGSAMQAGAGLIFPVDNLYETLIVGFAVRDNRAPITRDIFTFRNAASTQLEVQRDTNGAVYFTRNGTLVGSKSASSVFKNNIWQYMEVKAQISDSTTTTLEIRMNGVPVLTLASGLDSKNLSATGVNGIYFDEGGSSNNLFIDDLYILTPSGNSQDFLGDCRVYTIFPSGNGTTNNWVANTGTNWQAVDESSPDADSTYVSSSTLNNIDLYELDNVPSSGSIAAIQTNCVTKKDDAGTYTISHIIRMSGVNYESSGISVTSSYSYSLRINERNLNTSGVWTYDDVNLIQAGIKVASTGTTPSQGGGA